MAYIATFPLPHDRADFNTALARATAIGVATGKGVNAGKMIPAYGKVARIRSGKELKAIAMSMVTKKA